MPGLISGNFCLMLQCQTDIVETFEQAVTGEFINREGCCEFLIVSNRAAFQINCELVIRNFLGPPGDLFRLVFFQDNCQDAILDTVIGEDIGK